MMVAIVDRATIDTGILQEREDERLTRRDVIRQFAGAEIAPAVRAHKLPDLRTRWERAIEAVAYAVVRAEEPQLVAENESADIETVVIASESLRRPGRGDDLFRVALPRVAVTVTEDIAGEGVAARLGDYVDDSTGRATVLRFVAAGLHVDFAD